MLPIVELGKPGQRSDPLDFSLVLGGPLYRLWKRTRLAGDALQWLTRRILVLVALAWGVPLVLSAAARQAWGSRLALPLVHDVELHVRFLVALPLLIAAELVAHRRIQALVLQFLQRGLVPESVRTRFDAEVDSAMHLRNSVWAELLLVALVYGVGMGLLWHPRELFHLATWRGAPVDGRWQPSMAGWWLGCVSMPLFQFLLLRWYYRLLIWARFLWRVSRIELKLLPLHPDRCGGLGFLAAVGYTFSPVLLAQGALLAGMMANRILYAGAKLPEFKVELAGLVAVMVFAILGPLLAFAPQLEAAKRVGLREVGALAHRYVREFDDKWLRGAPQQEPLVGSADIQSLADLGNSFAVVEEMRWVPFTLRTVLRLAVTTLLPVLPLALTIMSPGDLLDRLFAIVF